MASLVLPSKKPGQCAIGIHQTQMPKLLKRPLTVSQSGICFSWGKIRVNINFLHDRMITVISEIEHAIG